MLDLSLQVRKEPKEVQKERQAEAAAANAARVAEQRAEVGCSTVVCVPAFCFVTCQHTRCRQL